jgi:hypothetical protein
MVTDADAVISVARDQGMPGSCMTLVDPAKGDFPPPRLLHLGLINEYERAA